jgi:hypothetical protein
VKSPFIPIKGPLSSAALPFLRLSLFPQGPSHSVIPTWFSRCFGIILKQGSPCIFATVFWIVIGTFSALERLFGWVVTPKKERTERARYRVAAGGGVKQVPQRKVCAPHSLTFHVENTSTHESTHLWSPAGTPLSLFDKHHHDTISRSYQSICVTASPSDHPTGPGIIQIPQGQLVLAFYISS